MCICFLYFILKLNILQSHELLFFIMKRNDILYFLSSEEHILMFPVSLSLSLSHSHTHTHTYIRTHTLSLLFHNEGDVVTSMCTLQCEVSTVKTKRMNYDPSFKPRAICYSKVVTLVTTTVTAPCNFLLSFSAVSLGSRVTVPIGAGFVHRWSHAWQLNKILLTSVIQFSAPKNILSPSHSQNEVRCPTVHN